MPNPLFFRPSGPVLTLPLVWAVLLGLLAVRLVAITVSPLGPGVDEAQYWLWGQTPQLGYYSKPPLIAWILALTDRIFADQIIGLRVAAPVLHLLSALILWQTGAVMFSEKAGRLAAVLWASLPVVGLGSFVMSTDTPMLLFWSAGLFCFTHALQASRYVYRWIICCGICIGLAALAKYAGLYFLLGVLAVLGTDRSRRGRQRVMLVLVFCMAVLVTSLPTWVWNISNGFVTILHLGENANLQDSQASFSGAAAFWAAQLGVAGPVVLVMLVFTTARAGHGEPGRWLHLFVWPVLVIMTVQAVLKEANANWAVAAYPAAILLVSQMIVASRQRLMRRAGQLAVLVNLVICSGFIAASASGSLGPFAPASDPFRHLKGWPALAEQTLSAARTTGARTIIAYDRESAALLHWHLQGHLQGEGLAIVLPRLGPGAGNHYHRRYPLSPRSARPLLALTDTDSAPTHLPVEADWRSGGARSEVKISRRDSRRVWFWLAD